MSRTREQEPATVKVGRLLDDAVLLGANLVDSKYQLPEEISENHRRQVMRLFDRAEQLKGIPVVFSGFGLAPVIHPCGNRTTGYTRVECGRGFLNQISVQEPSGLPYYMPALVELDEDDEDEVELRSALDLLDPEEEALLEFKSSLLDAPSGLRVMVEFLVRSQIDIDAPIRGIAIRAPSIIEYILIDASTLKVIHIDEHYNHPLVETYMLDRVLDSFSYSYRKLLRNKHFRNLQPEKQRMLLEHFISTADDQLGIDRFIAGVTPQRLFVPNHEEPSGFEVLCKLQGFEAKCLRIGCIELEILNGRKAPAIRKRRGNINSAMSLCIVAEVDDHTRDSLGVDSSIVWIPLTNQLDDMYFYEPDIL